MRVCVQSLADSAWLLQATPESESESFAVSSGLVLPLVPSAPALSRTTMTGLTE
jgi:hypothetical protein